MKTNNGINAVTVKLHTQELTALRKVALKALGGTEVYTEPGLSIVKLANGNVLEIYGPGSNYPHYLFRKNNVVVGYSVPDLEEAVREAEYSGLKTISSGKANGTCYQYFHLSDADGNLIELRENKT